MRNRRFSGVRLEVLGTFLGDDGLKVKDLSEMRIDYDEVGFQLLTRITRFEQFILSVGLGHELLWHQLLKVCLRLLPEAWFSQH